jgi:hypothetical protein
MPRPGSRSARQKIKFRSIFERPMKTWRNIDPFAPLSCCVFERFSFEEEGKMSPLMRTSRKGFVVAATLAVIAGITTYSLFGDSPQREHSIAAANTGSKKPPVETHPRGWQVIKQPTYAKEELVELGAPPVPIKEPSPSTEALEELSFNSHGG